MGEITCTLLVKQKFKIKAKLPRKLKKEIIKVYGREAYRDIINAMSRFYGIFGYVKFNIKRK